MPRGNLQKLLVDPDQDLAAVIGPQRIPRTELAKKIWDYIHANKLQDQKNRRLVNTDAKLAKVCAGRAQVGIFELTGFINKHVKRA